MSFTSEIAAMKAEAKVAPPTTTELPIGGGLPEHGAPHPETKPVEAAAIPAPVKSGPIKIGTEVFENPEDAIAYATELQQTLAQKDAFEMGRQSAMPKEEEVKPIDPFEAFGTELFENPSEALKKIHAKAVADAKKQIEDERRQEETKRQTWDSFYSQNADLSQNREIVEYVLQKNWDSLQNMNGDKALKILADKSRAFLGSTRVASLPSRDLPSGPAVTPSATGGAPIATPEKPSEVLDFITQVNKHRRRQV